MGVGWNNNNATQNITCDMNQVNSNNGGTQYDLSITYGASARVFLNEITPLQYEIYSNANVKIYDALLINTTTPCQMRLIAMPGSAYPDYTYTWFFPNKPTFSNNNIQIGDLITSSDINLTTTQNFYDINGCTFIEGNNNDVYKINYTNNTSYDYEVIDTSNGNVLIYYITNLSLKGTIEYFNTSNVSQSTGTLTYTDGTSNNNILTWDVAPNWTLSVGTIQNDIIDTGSGFATKQNTQKAYYNNKDVGYAGNYSNSGATSICVDDIENNNILSSTIAKSMYAVDFLNSVSYSKFKWFDATENAVNYRFVRIPALII